MQVLGRMEFAKDYFTKGLSESPAEGSGREELADVEDLISDKSEVCNSSIKWCLCDFSAGRVGWNLWSSTC